MKGINEMIYFLISSYMTKYYKKYSYTFDDINVFYTMCFRHCYLNSKIGTYMQGYCMESHNVQQSFIVFLANPVNDKQYGLKECEYFWSLVIHHANYLIDMRI